MKQKYNIAFTNHFGAFLDEIKMHWIAERDQSYTISLNDDKELLHLGMTFQVWKITNKLS